MKIYFIIIAFLISIIIPPSLAVDPGCLPGYFYNSTNQTCDNCYSVLDNCMACLDSSTCTQCYHFAYLQNGKCILNCSEGQYVNPQKSSIFNCLNCTTQCKKCNNLDSCIECYSPYSWNETAEQCLLPHGCVNTTFYYNESISSCQKCSSILPNCDTCFNGQCLTCYDYDPEMIISNGHCICPQGTYANPNQQSSEPCIYCTQNCLNCTNNISCTQCASSFSWNETSQLCQKNIIDLTKNVTTYSQGNYWELQLNTTGIPQSYQIKLDKSNLPGAFYWTKNTIYPKIYISTNCSSQCTGFNLANPPNKTTNCFETPPNVSGWNLLTDDSIAGVCYLQFFVPSDYELNQTYSFFYYPEMTLKYYQQYIDYYWQPQLFRYFTYSLSNFSSITNAQFSISLEFPSTQLGQIYLGTSSTSSNCNYVIPSSTHHCDNLSNKTQNGTTTITYQVNDPNSTFYLAISPPATTNNQSFINLQLSSFFTCLSGYYQPSYYNNKCLQIINETTLWNLDTFSTQWQDTNDKYWLFTTLNYTENTNNIYSLNLASNQSLGTFHLFMNEYLKDSQAIYISTNCSNSTFCPDQNFTSSPSYIQNCQTVTLGEYQLMWSLNIEQNNQCNFYFTIPSTSSKPPIQFAYYPKLTLYSSKNYTNLYIPWVQPTIQYFTYQINEYIPNSLNVIINKLNQATVQDFLFSSKDIYYYQQCYNIVFPTYGQCCQFDQDNYTIQNVDYSSYEFSLANSSSYATFGFATTQNGSYKSFDIFSSSKSFSHQPNTTCQIGQYYNYSFSECIFCNETLAYCSSCKSSYQCQSCSNNLMVIDYQKCQCKDGYYANPQQNLTTPCLSCPIHCKICNNNTSCQQCSFGYYMNQNLAVNSTDFCLACLPHCQFCTNSTYCITCESPYQWDQYCFLDCPDSQYYNQTTSTCVNCSESLAHCAQCSSSTSCTECESGTQLLTFRLISGECYPICSRGYYINPNHTSSLSSYCLSCLPNCNACDNDTYCSYCQSPFIWNSDLNQCACKAGSYYQSGQCQECSDYCESCTSGSNCNKCKSSTSEAMFTLANGQCQLSCKSGTYQNPNGQSSNYCLDCMEYCIQCQNSDTCSKCSENYVWDQTTLECRQLCEQGDYYDPKTKDCEVCEVDYCENCSNDGKGCKVCMTGYEIKANPQGDVYCKKKTKESLQLFAGISIFLLILLNLFI